MAELAAATGHREGAIRLGLEWLAAGGHVAISGEGDAHTARLSAGKDAMNPYVQKEVYLAVRGILEESAAYRQYFARANLESVMGSALV